MKIIKFTILFVLTAACIDPINIKNTSTNYAVVVDGVITDQPGPYTVKLSETTAISNQLDISQAVSGAILKITDDNGTSETLTETQAGVYQTATIVGTVGRTYTLSITTKEGNNYQSSPEKLLPVGAISDLRYEFIKTIPLTAAGATDTKDGFSIFLDSKLEPEQEGRVRWRWTGTFEMETFPKLITKPQLQNGEIIQVPNPPPCSGYRDSTGVLVKTGTCTCCTCWFNQYSSTPQISSNVAVGSSTINNVKISFIQANKYYFYSKYVLKIDQLSCSPAVYDFWQSVNTQEGQSGDLFQTPPAPTGGNILAVSAGAPRIIGIFAASAIKTQTITLTKTEAATAGYYIPAIDTLVTECFHLYRYSSIHEPSFW